MEMVRKIIGDGKAVLFWKDRWLGHDTLMDIFPRLFLISIMKIEAISALGGWVNEEWVWNLKWRRNIFEWE